MNCLGVDFFGHVAAVTLPPDVEGTDALIASVGRLTGLNELDLSGTCVTDSGLRNLKGLTELRRLNLNSTSTSDAGLGQLRELKKLESLNWISHPAR